MMSKSQIPQHVLINAFGPASETLRDTRDLSLTLQSLRVDHSLDNSKMKPERSCNRYVRA